MKDIEIVVFQDKSWVRFTEYQKLKEENEQLQKNNKHIQELINAERQRQEECNNVHLRDIATLEKENAELKKQQFSLRNERNTFLAQNEQYEKDLIDFNENLTKAKEIIKDLLRVLPKENIEGVYEITEEAEQFIRKNT